MCQAKSEQGQQQKFTEYVKHEAKTVTSRKKIVVGQPKAAFVLVLIWNSKHSVSFCFQQSSFVH